MAVAGVVADGYLLDVVYTVGGFEPLRLEEGARVTDLHTDSILEVDVVGDEVHVNGSDASVWTITGNGARFDACSGAWLVDGDQAVLDGCRADVPDFAYTGPVVAMTGNRNRWLGGLIRAAASAGDPAVVIDAGEANAIGAVDVIWGPSGDYALEVSGTATRTRINDVHFDPQAVPITGRITAADGTCEASETKEWGFGGVVVTGTSVLLRAWRELHLYRVVVTLGTAGGGDTDGDVLVNGSTVGSFTVPAAATVADAHLDVELDLDDLVAIEITAAGAGAQDITVQAELLR